MALSDFIDVFGGIAKVFENPLLAWLLALSILLADAGLVGNFVPFLQTGIIGGLITLIVNWLGIHIVISSFQILIIFAVTPIFFWALANSVKINKTA